VKIASLASGALGNGQFVDAGAGRLRKQQATLPIPLILQSDAPHRETSEGSSVVRIGRLGSSFGL
jgi:hypothetical protein